METKENRRLFFGIEVQAPWPQQCPHGRLIREDDRHMTLVFLGDISYAPLQENLHRIPSPHFSLGFAGIFNQVLFLPSKYPRVVAWHTELIDKEKDLEQFQNILAAWLFEQGIVEKIDERPFLPHVTMARKPFAQKHWKKAFIPLPCATGSIHLYESKGNLCYESIWSLPLLSPIEELPHTADVAFRVRGKNLVDIALHAQLALAFAEPRLLEYLDRNPSVRDEADIVMLMNKQIAACDEKYGASLKAVSYAGRGIEERENCMQWEMIVDV